MLKLPPELAVSAIRIVANVEDAEERKRQLLNLRPTIPGRTLLNAYVLPSLKELGLYEGALRGGSATRFGRAVAEVSQKGDDRALELVAQQLLALDRKRVGFVDWLLASPSRATNEVRRVVFTQFLRDTLRGNDDSPDPNALDRLGKWVGYLVYFRLLRGDTAPGASTGLEIDPRHIKALSEAAGPMPPDTSLRNALLNAYARSTRKVGSRLYIPVGLLRDELGNVLQGEGVLLTDAQIDDILRKAPDVLTQHTVTFSPFSGPSRGGLKLEAPREMYAGFISVRPRDGDNASDEKSPGLS